MRCLSILCGPETEFALNWRQFVAIWITFLITAGVSYHAAPMFFPSLMKEFHTDQYGVSWLPGIFQLTKGVFTLPGGFALHRFGISRCIRWGALLILATTAYYPFASSLVELSLLHGINGLAYNLCGLAPVIVFVTSWFEKQRAFAIGSSVTAFSIAGVVFPPVVAKVVDQYGWRAAAGILPVLMGLTLPLTFGVLNDGPFVRKELPKTAQEIQAFSQLSHQESYHDGEASCVARRNCVELREAGSAALEHCPPPQSIGFEVHEAGSESSMDCPPRPCNFTPPLSFTSSLRLSAVWHLSFLSFYVLYIVVAFINTLVLYLKEDVGLSLETCGLYTSIIFGVSIFGKLFAGAGLDLSKKRAASACSCFLFVIGTCLPLKIGPGGLQPSSNHVQLMVFAVVYGLGFGTMFTVTSSMPAKMFGTIPEFSKLQAFLMLFQVLGGFLGTLLTTKLRSATGSYTLSFVIFVSMALLCCVHCVGAELAASRLPEDLQIRTQASRAVNVRVTDSRRNQA